MPDSLMVAKLTVMLLRASLPGPDSLGPAFRILLAPDSEALPVDLALKRISALQGLHTFRAELKDGNLAISLETPTAEDEHLVGYRLETFDKGWRRLNPRGDRRALVEVRGFDETVVVSIQVVDDFLHFANCRHCSLKVSAPRPDSFAGVVAVLQLGDEPDEGR